MTEEEMLSKIQAAADKTAQNFAFKRTAKLDLIYSETRADGVIECYCLGSDMPLLVYRIFEIDAEGNVTEKSDVQNASEKTRHYNQDVRPGLKLIPPAVTESNEYEILVENKLETNNAVEVKLKSSIGRDITMIEIYRYFDYVSKVYFVSCVSVSFGGQYLFSVAPDNKHLRLIVGNNPELRARIDMITELLQARLLPSYQTIAAGAQLLSDKNVKAHVTLNGQNGEKINYDSTFCYDDPETQTRFAFFAKSGNEKEGIILVQDIFTQKLTMSNTWTEEQKAAVDKFKALMKENPEEFNKHTCSFFTDDLDFRYAAYKAGKLTPEAQPQAPVEPTEAK